MSCSTSQKLVNQVKLVDEVHSNYSDFFESILKTHFLPNLTGQPSLMMLNASYLLSQLVWVVLVLLILHNILLFSFLCQLPLLLHWFCQLCCSLLLPLFYAISWRLSDVLLISIISLLLTSMTLCCHYSPRLCTDMFVIW